MHDGKAARKTQAPLHPDSQPMKIARFHSAAKSSSSGDADPTLPPKLGPWPVFNPADKCALPGSELKARGFTLDSAPFHVKDGDHDRLVTIMRGPKATKSSDVVLLIPGTTGWDSMGKNFEHLQGALGSVFENKIVVLVETGGKQAGQGKGGKPFMALLPDYLVDVAGWLFQLTEELGSKLYYGGFSRGAMWGGYLAHKRPDWFAGFVLAGSYPLWTDVQSSTKSARQLVETKVPVSFLFSEKDWACNPESNPAYFAWILTADVGTESAQKSPAFHVFATEHTHEYLENVFVGRLPIAGETDRVLFEQIWSSVFGGISDRLQSIQIE